MKNKTKKIDIKNIVIVSLCITLICISFGFAFISSRLDYKTKEEKIFRVEITKITEATSIKGGTKSPIGEKEIINDGLTAKFNITMNAPNDELSYIIKIKNTGNIKAKIIDIVSSPNYISNEKLKAAIYPVVISYDSAKDKILSPGDEKTITLVLKYGITPTEKQVSFPYELSLLTTSRN